MLQEITAYIILIISFGIFFYKLIHFFDVFKESENNSACSTCSVGSCDACAFNPLSKLNTNSEKTASQAS